MKKKKDLKIGAKKQNKTLGPAKSHNSYLGAHQTKFDKRSFVRRHDTLLCWQEMMQDVHHPVQPRCISKIGDSGTFS